MKKVLLSVLVALALGVFPAAAGAAIENGSFEDSGAGWNQASVAFDADVICSSLCGSAATAGPRTGSYWVWFGGTPGAETASVSQVVPLAPAGSTKLRFHLWWGMNSAPTSLFTVTFGGVQLFSLGQEGAEPYGEYRPVTIDLSKYADGTARSLNFDFTKADGGNTNVSLDDIEIITAPYCVVPKVKKGAKVKAAKKKLKKSACKAGKVTKKKSSVKKGRVINLQAKSGKKLGNGARVKILVSKGK